MEASDAELLDRLRAGDEQAFAVLVRRYQPSLLRLARSVVHNASVAEEAVQDTWLGVVRGVDRFEGRSSVKTWLFHILMNRARSAASREQRVASTNFGLAPDEDARFDGSGAWAVPPVEWAAQADDRIVAEQLARRAMACLDGLPAAQRQAVLLRDVEGLDAHEVCAALGVSAGNLRVLLHRGRGRVRNLLDAEMGRG